MPQARFGCLGFNKRPPQNCCHAVSPPVIQTASKIHFLAYSFATTVVILYQDNSCYRHERYERVRTKNAIGGVEAFHFRKRSVSGESAHRYRTTVQQIHIIESTYYILREPRAFAESKDGCSAQSKLITTPTKTLFLRSPPPCPLWSSSRFSVSRRFTLLRRCSCTS